jgi:hypothetical protein
MTIDPQKFLNTVSQATRADFKKETSASRPIRLAVIDPSYTSGNPRVTFEGEETLSDKEYPYANYTPAAGDRVVMLPLGTSYVIIGAVGESPGGGGGFDPAVALEMTSYVRSTRTNGTDNAFLTRRAADTTNRLVINADGNHLWGPGGVAAGDTNLYRSSADLLRTDDNFHVQGNLTVGGTYPGGGGSAAPLGHVIVGTEIDGFWSTTYNTGLTACEVSFVAPSTGVVMIWYSAWMQAENNGSGSASIFASIQVTTATGGGGTVMATPDETVGSFADAYALRSNKSGTSTVQSTPAKQRRVTGLTSGVTYYARFLQKTAGTEASVIAHFAARQITVYAV